ncbi:MAG: hypothetical protein NVS3B1_07780 [Marmoricola sp.]
MSQLLPVECEGLADAPYTVVNAISTALAFLSFEEWPREDRPPKRIWFKPEEMESHWQRVKKQMGSGGANDIDRPIEGPAEDNLAARDLISYD